MSASVKRGFQTDRRSPHDFVLAADGRALPFGDFGDGATAAGADAGTGQVYKRYYLMMTAFAKFEATHSIDILSAQK